MLLDVCIVHSLYMLLDVCIVYIRQTYQQEQFMQNHAFMSTANFGCIFVETWLATLHICRKLAGTFAYLQFVAKCVHKLELQMFLQRSDSFEFHARGQLKNCNLLKTFENVHSAQGVSRWKASLLVY